MYIFTYTYLCITYLHNIFLRDFTSSNETFHNSLNMKQFGKSIGKALGTVND